MAGNVIELSDADFATNIGKGTVLVDFWASWCGPCRMQGPILEKVAAAATGKAVVAKLNVDESPETAGQYGIQSIPTLILFQGGKEAKRFVGLQTEAALKQALGVA